MRLTVRPAGVGVPRIPALWIGLAEGDRLDALKLPVALRRPVASALGTRDATGRANQVTIAYSDSLRPVLAGLGPRKGITADTLRRAAATAARKLQALGVKDVGVWLPAACGKLSVPAAAAALAEGFNDGGYAYNAWRTKPSDRVQPLESLTFIVARADVAPVKSALSQVRPSIAAVNFARDLANRPANDLTPRALAESAQLMARTHGLTCRAFGPRELEKMGCGALLGVSRGSTEEPRFIELTYSPRGRSRATLVYVGKGITFDSGGISLKPADNMDRMRFDMCGAAAVVGAMQAIADLKPPVKVVGLVAASENMPGGKAFKPGDVLKALNGTTIEITNTDAEGRLVLADALSYASRFKPAAVVDLATLTGACVVALGTLTSGFFTDDEKLCARLTGAAQLAGERMWRMPLWEEYGELMKSDLADVKNSSAIREAGACTAAIFLKRFTNYPWAHLDIAGVGHLDRERAYLARGGTGYGVRSLVQLALNWE